MTILWPFSLFYPQTAGSSPSHHASGGGENARNLGEPVPDVENAPLDAQGQIPRAAHLNRQNPDQARQQNNADILDRPRRRGAFSSETVTEEDVANYVKAVSKAQDLDLHWAIP